MNRGMGLAQNYETFKTDINKTLGIDLNAYKEQQMRRRINQWLNRYDLESFDELIRKIQDDPEHRSRFTEYLTINTSHFFRDTTVFSAIDSTVIPDITRHNKRPRIWSAGASIGAEIYSIAIMLAEKGVTARELLATDIDQAILTKAEAGVYHENQISNIEPVLLSKYFIREGTNSYVIHDGIRKQVTFRQHDLLKDPYQRDFDLILCRNVFIYFTAETQKRLISNFVESLRPGGYFVVGSAEQIMDPGSYDLQRVSYCIYQKT
mgnify:CR=1 FL=1